MNTTRIMGITIFCIGLVLLIFAFSATQSLLESVVKWFAGYYTEHTMIAIFVGIALFIFGGIMAFRSRP